MTETIEAPTAVKPIHHWIGGQSYEGRSGRSGPVFNPATGQQTGVVDFATPEEVDRAVQAAKAASPAWRAMSLSTPRRALLPHPPALRRASEDIARLLTAEHGKVLSDALGEVARGLEVIEFCCGLPQLLKGEHERAGLDGHRRVLDPPAARRRRRHHAVQLPGDGADVDVGAGARVRQHVRAEAVGEGPVRVDLLGRAAQGGRRARRRLQRRPRRQGRGRRRCSSTPTSRPSASSARRRSPSTSTRPARRTASGCRRSAGRRTT